MTGATPIPESAQPVRARIIVAAEDARLRQRLCRLLAQDYDVREGPTIGVTVTMLAATMPDAVLVAPAPGEEASALAMLSAQLAVRMIILAGAPGEGAIIRALDAGAEDALGPAWTAGELLARLRRVLRRPVAASPANEIAFGAFTLDLDTRELRAGGRVVALTRLEYRLLEELAAAGGRVVEHGVLLTRVWGPRHEERSHYLREYIARLRRKLGPHGGTPFIVNVARVGYRLDLRAAPDVAPR